MFLGPGFLLVVDACNLRCTVCKTSPLVGGQHMSCSFIYPLDAMCTRDSPFSQLGSVLSKETKFLNLNLEKLTNYHSQSDVIQLKQTLLQYLPEDAEGLPNHGLTRALLRQFKHLTEDRQKQHAVSYTLYFPISGEEFSRESCFLILDDTDSKMSVFSAYCFVLVTSFAFCLLRLCCCRLGAARGECHGLLIFCTKLGMS